jgi:signal transduction histidine kinase
MDALDARRGKGPALRRLPVMVGLAALAATVVLWSALDAEESGNIRRTVRYKSDALRDTVANQVESRTLALIRMSKRWEVQGRPSREEWESDAGLYLSHYPGYRSIEWVDASFKARWAVTLAADGPVREDSTGIEGRLGGAFVSALEGKEAVLTRLAASGTDGNVLAAVVPVNPAAGFEGFIVGVFKVRDLFDDILRSQVMEGYSAAVLDRGEEIYMYDVSASRQGEGRAEAAEVTLSGAAWSIRTWPTPASLNAMESRLPEAALVSGVFVSFLLALAVHFAGSAQERATAAEASNAGLEAEIAERRKAEEAAERHAGELKALNVELEREVAERKKAEENAERQAADLARSNAELEQFAYVASHDLQEPLRVISGYVQLLSRRYRGRLGADADEFIGFAADGASRMQALISDLLAYSRAGIRRMDMTPCGLDAVLGAALVNLRSAVEESGAIVTRDALPEVVADATQMGQLMQNLIGNAIKYRGAEAPRIHVSSRREADEWVFSVRDNGIGIDPIYHERIFVIFQRLHGKTEHTGTGIGLAICKKIVEGHGGRIWVESREGAGASFYFTMPIGRRG